MAELTDKRKAFCEEYCNNGHNATQAYKKAYPNCKGGWDKLGPRLMGKDGIRTEIDRIKTERRVKAVASRSVRQAFWSDMMQDIDTPKPERLRASELLGRSEADFTDNIANTVPDQSQVLTKDEQVEALRQQIRLLTDAEEAGTAIAV